MCVPKLGTEVSFLQGRGDLRRSVSGPTSTNRLVTAEARRRRILQLLENEGNVKVEELAVLFEVSQVTDFGMPAEFAEAFTKRGVRFQVVKLDRAPENPERLVEAIL